MVYAVDGSGYNPSFYSGYYNNARSHGIITLYGIEHADTDERKNYYTSSVQDAISSIGVTQIKGLYVGTTASTALIRMKESMIWVVHTHGSMQSVTFNHSTEGETNLYYYDIYSLNENALESERCVIYGTCNAGQGREETNNMVNVTHEKGAMTVIGWEEVTYVAQMNVWLEAFLIASGNGETILEAKETAQQAVNEEFNGVYGGLDKVYIKGSQTQKLIS